MAMKYHEEEDRKIYFRLKELLVELPSFCSLFFRGIEPRTQARTRLAYAYDLHVFFTFILQENPVYSGKTMKEIPLSLLDEINARDIEEYMEYLKYRPGENGEGEIMNRENGVKRKISSLKSFYNYYFEGEMIRTNPAALVHLPKIRDKEIVRLDYNETVRLLDEAETGEQLTDRQKAFHKRTKNRDVALLSLFLGTGMRISECVGIDLSDIDLEETAVRLHRKGGKEETVFFSDEVAAAVKPWYEERLRLLPAEGSEKAFFLSLRNSRITVRSVENLVKKYAQVATPLKHITPHKLRSTYGTHLYQETGDIYLVADVLGHSDVNTTKKHYAAIDEERRRSARSAVRLREN